MGPIVHQIDPIYVTLPEDIVFEGSLNPVAFTGDYKDLHGIDEELSKDSNNAISNSTVTESLDKKVEIVDLTLPTGLQWKSVCYGNGMFVAIDGSEDTVTNSIVYSEDGLSWKWTHLNQSYYWVQVYHADNKFVAIGYSSNNRIESRFVSACSLDGISWEVNLSSIQFFPREVYYADGMFSVVGELQKDYYNTINFLYSYDGIYWRQSKLTYNTPDYYRSIAYANGMYIIVPKYGNYVYSTTSSFSYAQKYTTLKKYDNWKQICHNDSTFLIVPQRSNYILYGHDYSNWYSVDLPVDAEWGAACFGGDKFILVGANSNIAVFSHDCVNWTQVSLPFSANWSSICYGNGQYMLIASDSDLALSSKDGVTWHGLGILKNDEDITNNAFKALKKDLDENYIGLDNSYIDHAAQIVTWEADD